MLCGMEMSSLIDDLGVTEFGQNYLKSELQTLVKFAKGSLSTSGGFGYLNADGSVNYSKPLELWINCRMTHLLGLATALEIGDFRKEVEHGVNALLDIFEDKHNGGFYNSCHSDGTPSNDKKLAYDQSFVLLTASTARAIGVARAEILFNKVDAIIDEFFWDPKYELMVNEWNADFSILAPYRGVNANMHAVEAFCAVYELTGTKKYLDRAHSICKSVVNNFSRQNNWMLPEHFNERWEALKDYNVDNPADPFCPYGVTIGHLFEWARLILQIQLLLRESEDISWILEAATHMYELGSTYGWAPDGAEGFIYTMDWDKKPVVTSRMHWVAAEATMTAYTMWYFTKNNQYISDYNKWWQYIDTYVIDRKFGSWNSELNPNQEVVEFTWPGKPDTYHAVNACLLPLFPMSASFLGMALKNNLQKSSKNL